MKNWSKGDRVTQPTYGAGTLVEVNEHHTVIDFDEGGRRVFATRLVVLQATNEPAPHKAPTRKRGLPQVSLYFIPNLMPEGPSYHPSKLLVFPMPNDQSEQ